MATSIRKITPHLWYDRQAIEAANFYVSIFPQSQLLKVRTLKDTPSGDTDVVWFELCGQDFMAISAGPLFKFNEAISFVVHCDDQDEIDLYWEKLSAGGEEGPCGWLKDKFGLSWQIVPNIMNEMLKNASDAQLHAVTQAFLKMKKFDISALRSAYDTAAS